MYVIKLIIVISVIFANVKRHIVIEKEDIVKFLVGKHVKDNNSEKLAALSLMNDKTSNKRIPKTMKKENAMQDTMNGNRINSNKSKQHYKVMTLNNGNSAFESKVDITMLWSRRGEIKIGLRMYSLSILVNILGSKLV